MSSASYTTVSSQQMQEQFERILLKHGFNKTNAAHCAEIFTANSIDGVYTHGVNRFPRFVQYVQQGLVKPNEEPSVVHSFGALEQWNGNLAPGVLNAVKATERAMTLSNTNGIGCVAIANTNHWMRAGYYGWKAAKQGYILIAWTNTIGIMPAWKAMDSRLGNNPLVFAVPYNNEAIVLDMAMSQFSYGAMEMAEMKGDNLSVAGGFDEEGNVTNDPTAILKTKRPLSIGYWKGAGLSLLLDILASVLSAGLSTKDISAQTTEHAVSQVFIAIDPSKLHNHAAIATTINNIIDDYKQSVPADSNAVINYPGERVVHTRQRNLEKGIPVLKTVWDEVLSL